MKNRKKTLIFNAVLLSALTLTGCGNYEMPEVSYESLIISEKSTEAVESETTTTRTEKAAIVTTVPVITETEKNTDIDTATETTTSEASATTFTVQTTVATITTQEETQTAMQSVTEIPVTTKPEVIVSETEIISDISSEPEQETTGESDTYYIELAYQLMGELDYIDKIGSSNIPFYDDTAFTDDNGDTFAQVAKTQFSDTADLREFMESCLTEDFISERYSGILDTDEPLYIDVDGILYGKQSPKGGGFYWTNSEPVIENITDSSFNILAEYDNYGASETMSIEVVMSNGSWKINWVTFGL